MGAFGCRIRGVPFPTTGALLRADGRGKNDAASLAHDRKQLLHKEKKRWRRTFDCETACRNPRPLFPSMVAGFSRPLQLADKDVEAISDKYLRTCLASLAGAVRGGQGPSLMASARPPASAISADNNRRLPFRRRGP